MKTILAAALALGFIGLAGAVDEKGEKADPVGTWKCEYEIGDQKRMSTLTITKDGDKLAGTMSWPEQKEAKLTDVNLKDAELTFSAVRMFMANKIPIDYKFTVTGDKLKGKGSSDFGGKKQEFDIEGKRQERLEEVIAGMRSNRSELKSGRYSVSISETYSSGRKTTEKAECTFDFAAESLRFDRELNDAVGKRNWKFISTPGFACKWLVEVGPSAITIERPSETSDTGALDPRVIGLLLPAERFHYFQLDELSAALFEGEAEKLLLPDGGNGKQQISIIGGKNKEMRRLLTMDASRGYTLENLVFEHRSGDVWSGPQISIKTSWDRKENIWVPKTCQIEDKYASGSIRMDFTWKEVNTKISDKLFDIHAFHLPKGTLVCDKRLGFVMIMEKIGDESFKPRPAKPEAPGP